MSNMIPLRAVLDLIDTNYLLTHNLSKSYELLQEFPYAEVETPEISIFDLSQEELRSLTKEVICVEDEGVVYSYGMYFIRKSITDTPEDTQYKRKVISVAQTTNPRFALDIYLLYNPPVQEIPYVNRNG